MIYKTIYLDPPWGEFGGGKIKRGADKHYSLMKTKDIIVLLEKEIKPLIDEDAHCYLWVTNNFLKDGILVLESLGFRYITNIVWVKNNILLGQYFRGKHELCLFGVKGKFFTGNRSQSTVIIAPKREHSKKPDEMYLKIEAVSQSPRLEIFARNKRDGWDSWGDEIEHERNNR